MTGQAKRITALATFLVGAKGVLEAFNFAGAMEHLADLQQACLAAINIESNVATIQTLGFAPGEERSLACTLLVSTAHPMTASGLGAILRNRLRAPVGQYLYQYCEPKAEISMATLVLSPPVVVNADE
jgi:hypothetical protein